MEQLILNPLTKRYVKFGSANHKRLVANGTLSPPETMPAPKPKRLPEQNQQQKIDTEIIQQSVAVVEENREKFKGLSQEESNDLISRLLYDRLIAVPSKKLVGRPILNKQPKTRPSTIQRPIILRQKPKKKHVVSSDDDGDVSVTSSMIETSDCSSESD
jgi:hypothetical protein